jgi:nucleolar protein 4
MSDEPSDSTLQKKRKQKQRQIPQNKIFVRGLSKYATTKDLENLFSEIGPIKRCFIITQKGSTFCRGFGYVHFALESDAKKAIDLYDGKRLHGRLLKVTLARPRHRSREVQSTKTLQDESTKEEMSSQDFVPQTTADKLNAGSATTSQNVSIKESEPSSGEDGSKQQESDSNCNKLSEKSQASANDIFEKPIKLHKPKTAARTLVLKRLPRDVTHRQIQEIVGTHFIRSIRLTSVQNGVLAYVCYNNIQNAVKALKKINSENVELNGKKITAELFSAAALKKFRLIVRNLPFHMHEKELEKLFAPFGLLFEVRIPRRKDRKNLGRGFGFVNYTNIIHAKKAIEEGNKLTIKGRPIAVDWTVPKYKYKRLKQTEEPSTDESESDSASKSVSEKVANDNRISPSNDQKNAVDKQQKATDVQNNEIVSEEANEVNSDEEQSDLDTANDPNEADDVDSDAESETAHHDEDNKKDAQKNKENETKESRNNVSKKTLSSDVHLGKTLFLRNLSFDTTEEDLIERFKEFGPVRYCKLVVDSAGQPRGTAFIQFQDKEAADAVLRACGFDLEKDPIAATLPPDPSKSSQKKGRNDVSDRNTLTLLDDNGIVVDGRKLLITRAVTRTTAATLKQSNKKKKGVDKRNLHLAPLGEINIKSPEVAKFSAAELAKIQRAQREKKIKLANPNFHVSSTRLSVRNLSKNVTEKELKRAFLRAAQIEGDTSKIRIKQVKIVRDDTKLDDEGNPRSRGYGFVEFMEHRHALQALQSMNENSERFGLGGKQVNVQFAIENSLILKKREERIRAQKMKLKKMAKSQQSTTKVGSDSSQNSERKRKRETKREESSEASEPPAKIRKMSQSNRKNMRSGSSTKSDKPKSDNDPAIDIFDDLVADGVEQDNKKATKRRGKKKRTNKEGAALDKMISQRENKRPKKKWYQT